MTFCCPHCKATLVIKSLSTSIFKREDFPYSDVPVVRDYPIPANLLRVEFSAGVLNQDVVRPYNIGNVFISSLPTNIPEYIGATYGPINIGAIAVTDFIIVPVTLLFSPSESK
jgi:hypothetical protein